MKPVPSDAGRPEDLQALHHALHVHQIELEMQNQELRRTRDELEVSRESYFDLYDLAPVGYATLDREGLILQANLTLANRLECTRQALVGRPLSRFVSRESADAYTLQVRRLFESGEPASFEVSMTTAAGLPIWMLIDAAVRDDLPSATRSCRVTLTDVTERKRAEETLRAEQERFRTFFDLSPLGKAMMAPDGRFLHVNGAFCSLLGYSLGELEARTVASITHPADLARSLALVHSLLAAEQESGELEKRYLTRDGRVVWAHVKTRLLRDAAGNPVHFLTNILDITDRKAAEAALSEAYVLLESRVTSRTADLAAANLEMEAFTYSVSHDLRSPLRAIDGFGARLDRECGASLGEEGRRLLGVIRASTRQMAALIDDLLALSRVGRTEMKCEGVEMSGMALEVGREILREGGGRPEVEFQVGPLPAAWGSHGLLRQVWQNLLSNAFKFSAKVDRPVVQVEGESAGGLATYRVRDNGAGFDMAYQNKLFGVFQRLHLPTDFAGVGIGLALVKRIVTRHGGQVAAEGAVGEGATFTFSLPVAPTSPVPSSKA